MAILGIVPFLLLGLRRRGRLTPSSFALTVSAGTSLAILAAFYLGLLDVLVARRELALFLLGLILAAANFVLMYLSGRFFYKRFARLPRNPPRQG
jgi:hypothetical protein